MIRRYQVSDLDSVLDIWLAASIEAHDFVGPEFWRSKVDDMRKLYIPASEVFVCEHNSKVVGFYALHGKALAAIFVSPEAQGKGFGSELIEHAKRRRTHLDLTVYKENGKSVAFYKKRGFRELGEQTDAHTGRAELLMRWGLGQGAGSN